MNLPDDLEWQPFLRSGAGATGVLAGGCALSLRPLRASLLRVIRGRVWATLDGPHDGRGDQSGDHYLDAGRQLQVLAGRHLVMESFDGRPVWFDWTAATAGQKAMAGRWELAVRQPWRELQLALGLALRALLRLARARHVALRRQSALSARHGRLTHLP